MNNDLLLFRVTVTKEWRANAEALVWALDADTAGRLAKRRVEIDIDALESSSWASVNLEPLDAGVMGRMDNDDLWLIFPDGEVCENSRAGLAKFQAILSPERLEAIRLARIEAVNGQLAIFTDDILFTTQQAEVESLRERRRAESRKALDAIAALNEECDDYGDDYGRTTRG